MNDADRRCLAVASQGLGIVTRWQALRAGLSEDQIDRRLRSGGWEKIHPGVYRITGAPATWRQDVRAAALWGVEAVVSHVTAAAMWNFPKFQPGGLIHLTTHRNISAPARGIIVHRKPMVPPLDRATLSGIPVTSLVRTLFDVAGCTDEEIIEEIIFDLVNRRVTSISSLVDRFKLHRARGRDGSAALARVLSKIDPSAEVPASVLELRVDRVLRKSELPRYVRQFNVFDGTRFLGRVDFAWPEQKVAIEADGRATHGTYRAFHNDPLRRNELKAVGWVVLTVTWKGIKERPQLIVRQAKDALQLRGVIFPVTRRNCG